MFKKFKLLFLSLILLFGISSSAIINFASFSGGVAVPSEMVAYWKLDESTGSALDSLASYDASEVGTVPAATGIISGARGVFSTSNYFNWASGASSATVFDSSVFLIEAWINTSSTGVYKTIISKGNNSVGGGGGTGWQFGINSADDVSLFMQDAFLDTGGSVNVTDGAWHYVVGVALNNTEVDGFRIYVDGAVESTRQAYAWTKTNTDLRIGVNADSVSDPFIGLVDDSAYWNLTGTSKTWADIEAIILQRYNSGNAARYNR